MRTYVPSAKHIERTWWIVDASGQPLGRVATIVATLLMGKHKPNYVPFLDMGDYVIVVNAEKVVLTGRKLDAKIYRWHTGYLGGLKERTAREMLEKHPEKVIERAVSGMLPKNKLRKVRMRKLKVYRGESHPHQAQKPRVFTGFEHLEQPQTTA